MKKTITIYELLGLIKDGKAPKKIKYRGFIYEFKNIQEGVGYVYQEESHNDWLANKIDIDDQIALNENIEILDNKEEFEDIEEINYRTYYESCSDREIIKIHSQEMVKIKDKINQLIKNQKKIIERLNDVKK